MGVHRSVHCGCSNFPSPNKSIYLEKLLKVTINTNYCNPYTFLESLYKRIASGFCYVTVVYHGYKFSQREITLMHKNNYVKYKFTSNDKLSVYLFYLFIGYAIPRYNH